MLRTFSISSKLRSVSSIFPPINKSFLFLLRIPTTSLTKVGCSTSLPLVCNTQMGPVTIGSRLAKRVSRKTEEKIPERTTVNVDEKDSWFSSCRIAVSSLTFKLLNCSIRAIRLSFRIVLYLLCKKVRLGG